MAMALSAGVERWLRVLSPVAGVLCFGFALWGLGRLLEAYRHEELAAALASLPAPRLFLAAALTAAGYLVLVGYDFLAFRFIRRAMAPGSMAKASLVASALSFNLGSTAITGAAIRYWIYASLGLSASQVARVALFCSLGFWLGYLFLGALAFCLAPIPLPAGVFLPGGSTRPLGLLLLAILAIYGGLTARRRPLGLGRWRLSLPSPALTLGQVLVASVDLCLMAGVLYVLLPPATDLSCEAFLPLFLVALIGGTVSQVPGGLGVFETVMVLLLAPKADAGDLVAALLAFRVIYFILPLGLALGFVALRVGHRRRRVLLPFLARLRRRLEPRSALLLASPALAMGAALLFSGPRLVAGGFLALGLVLHRLQRDRRREPRPADAADLARAAAIARASPRTYANLVFQGDKALLFSQSRRSFLMYGRHGRTWVALGDPVGPEEEMDELVGRFRDLVASRGGWCAFFEVGEERRDFYARFGFSFTLLGEQARVPLHSFSLNSPAARQVRQARARCRRRGCVFEVVEAAAVPALLPELKAVSDAWLAGKHTREKSFSNASFKPAYLAHFPVALVRREGRIIAFANVWLGGDGEEMAVDLMRHHPEAPCGTMDFLFAELFLWGRERGYRSFDFGMAPLAGLGPGAGAPLWQRIGSLLYRHGRHFYSFAGLHRYKDKFNPVWTPLYLASPGGLALAPILVDVTALMAGGLGGIISKASPSISPAS